MDRTDQASRLEHAAASLVSRLVDAGIEGVGPLDPAAVVADRALARARDIEAGIDEVVVSHQRLAAANGFVTGIGGIVTLPIGLPANIIGFYAVATRMVAAVARLRGYDLAQPAVRSAVLLTLVGADATSLLAKAGLSPTARVAGLAARRLPAPALMVLNKGIGFRLLTQMSKNSLGRLGRGVPLAGGMVGAGWDWWLMRRLAADAREEFVPRQQLPG